ncbi:MAG TPA: Smr/MutS family protein [Candidatus Binataceae bacterium]|nr:Smr/MutS family protein [Candidatus Binataceae bacterium]
MRKRKRSVHHRAADPTPKPAFDSPFKGLKGMLAAQRVAPAPPQAMPTPPPAVVPLESDQELFSNALAGVVPLGGPRPVPPGDKAAVQRVIVSEEAEVLAELSDLVSGQGAFDITETEEYVEGARMDLDPRLIVRLRRGEFAFEAYLDMHGMTQSDAHEELARFLRESIRQGRRTVLVVHGKGLGSPGGKGVLKHASVEWLSHGSLSAHVLGFVTARPIDGGTGALYVLLQRTRKRAPFDVLNGTKRRP